METKSAVLGAAGMLFAGGLAFASLGIANAINEPAPAPSTVATVAATEPAPEPVVTETPEPVVTPEPAPVVAEPVVEPAPVVAEPVAPAPVYVAPAPAPVYVAPVAEPGQNTYYTKPTAPPAVGPDPIKNTGLYDQPVTGQLYWNSDDAPK